ncbi:MAG: zinc-ribbon domain-containing protein [bacterium]
MFCPRCATQNLDDAKFCRACGTNLENVALAMADKYHPAKRESDGAQDPFASWLETRSKSINKIARGTGWFVSSLLIGVALGLFSNTPDWVIIWMCMVGWMAVLGVISMVSGTAGLMESRFLGRQLGQPSSAANAPVQPLLTGDRVMMNDPLTTPMLRPQSSVTEHTTTRLIKPEPPSNLTN